MKFIYLVESRQLNKTTNQFDILCYTDAYSSLKKAKAGIENSIECNKGYDRYDDTTSYLERNLGRIDYTTLGYGRDDTRVEMRIRLIINKVELK